MPHPINLLSAEDKQYFTAYFRNLGSNARDEVDWAALVTDLRLKNITRVKVSLSLS